MHLMPNHPSFRMALRRLFLLLVLLLPAFGCKLLVTPAIESRSGRVLFDDDFSSPASGWRRVTAATGASDYMDGVYRILVNEPNVDIWSRPGLKFGDVRIEVEAFKVGGDRDNRFGVICRAVDDDSFYTFIISSDGFYGIGMINDGAYQLIGMDALQPTDAIQLGSAMNHIRADCVGDTLTLVVNGVQLAQVKDNTFSSGDVGLVAGSYTTPGTDIRFDNFIVYEP
jgi:hypothetical protein